MKRTREGFEMFVKGVRCSMPEYNNGRRVVILSEYTKKGKEILDRASHWEGNDLRQVYESPSIAKQRAFDEVWQMYCESENASAFGICSHNTFNFTVSWVVPGCVWFITATTEYMVLCNE